VPSAVDVWSGCLKKRKLAGLLGEAGPAEFPLFRGSSVGYDLAPLLPTFQTLPYMI